MRLLKKLALLRSSSVGNTTLSKGFAAFRLTASPIIHSELKSCRVVLNVEIDLLCFNAIATALRSTDLIHCPRLSSTMLEL